RAWRPDGPAAVAAARGATRARRGRRGGASVRAGSRPALSHLPPAARGLAPGGCVRRTHRPRPSCMEILPKSTLARSICSFDPPLGGSFTWSERAAGWGAVAIRRRCGGLRASAPVRRPVGGLLVGALGRGHAPLGREALGVAARAEGSDRVRVEPLLLAQPRQ